MCGTMQHKTWLRVITYAASIPPAPLWLNVQSQEGAECGEIFHVECETSPGVLGEASVLYSEMRG